MRIYLVGSLKDPSFPNIAEALREAGFTVFDDWRGGGHDGDVRWRTYELNDRGRGYSEALFAPFAENNREFDRSNIDNSDVLIAVCQKAKLPGRSSIAELGYAKRIGKRTCVLLNGDPEEWDLMLPLVVDDFFLNVADVIRELKG